MARIVSWRSRAPPSTFPSRRRIAAKAFAALDGAGHTLVGTRALLRSGGSRVRHGGPEGRSARRAPPDAGDLHGRVHDGADCGERRGPWRSGRFRSRAPAAGCASSFCGLNLAAHALGWAGKSYRWLYAAPEAAEIDGRLNELVAGQARKAERAPTLPRRAMPTARRQNACSRNSTAGRSASWVSTRQASTPRYDEEEPRETRRNRGWHASRSRRCSNAPGRARGCGRGDEAVGWRSAGRATTSTSLSSRRA